MTKKELAKALEIAKSDRELESKVATNMFLGFGLKDFEPVYCTLEQVAWLIRYQCFYIFGGGMDMDELNYIARHGKRKFLIIG